MGRNESGRDSENEQRYSDSCSRAETLESTLNCSREAIVRGPTCSVFKLEESEDAEYKETKKKTNLHAKSRKTFLDIGWRVETVQHYNVHANRSQDFGGFGDLMMWYPTAPDTVVVQVCDDTHLAAHRKKILTNKTALDWISGPNSHRQIWIHSWSLRHRESSDGALRLGWNADIFVLTEREFLLCPLNLSLDVDIPVAPREQQQVTGASVSSTTRSKLALVTRSRTK